MTWAPDYVNAAMLKNYLHIEDTADDAFVALWITTSSRNVDDWCGRQFGNTGTLETRTYSTEWDRHLGAYVAEIDDVMETDDLTVIGSNAQIVTDFDLVPENNVKKNKPFERIVTSVGGKLTIDAVWGWNSVPSSVSVGMLLQAARLAARRDSPFGVAGSPSQGSEIRLLATLDADFKTALKPVVRAWWAA